ncbi:RecA/RadA recombinase [Marinobacterium lacunae]|uniref:RecA/RadA recombinase n=1 Tax=Marinobacterium lacunae TaxID=1232683 RepID=A0A081FWJ7_9GAMM|nr:translesion DNA synthesis-associated protein ImuA [Marinobacterium lacunae]KEA62902.1 RecA/RadA recombinase [Marinobacterium lacunae]
MALVNLLEQGQLWRGSHAGSESIGGVEISGYSQLDEKLYGGGWLKGQLVELLYSGEGLGEIRLIWPLLRRFSAESKPVFWIDPPHHLYPIALQNAGIGLSSQYVVYTSSTRDRLWTIEQVLKSGMSPLVLSWLDDRVVTSSLRRLQLAVQAGGGLGWVMRPESVRNQSSAAAYRMVLNRQGQSTELTLLKRRGGWPLPPFRIDLPAVI